MYYWSTLNNHNLRKALIKKFVKLTTNADKIAILFFQ